jgi:hypothetical protein
MPDGKLADGDEPCRDLSQAEKRCECELAHSNDSCRPLPHS